MPERIDGRYRVIEELGRGGMARVYRVIDDGNGRQLALKQLQRKGTEKQELQAAELFEREFRTLVQLSHPRVIEVYDYGIDEAGPYYTMELLDGSDLRELSPLPWPRACELIFDVCSSLALLHSRRLVHRDISPRNVRSTPAGNAKLIDFGAMVQMGPCAQVVGTPAFVAPEVVHRSALDARTDLYSVGATLYFALTGRMPYPARDLAGVLKAWSARPAAPSLLVPDIPAQLDALVMSMISLEPALRPRGAFEVMQRLMALPGVAREESASVSRAYLATPQMVGRDEALNAFRNMLRNAIRGRGNGCLVEAAAGLGRSRVLDAFALEAKLLGAVVLRAGARSVPNEPLAIARSLAEQLLDALPEPALAAARKTDTMGLFELSAAAGSGQSLPPARLTLLPTPEATTALVEFQQALVRWLLQVAGKHALCVAVDDVDGADAPSAALLAALAMSTHHKRLLVVAACEPGRHPEDSALGLLARECQPLALRALGPDETEALLCSLFGDVPNLALLSERIHASAGGRPRETMSLAQHLVESGTITYAGGGWTLPETLAPNALPGHAQEVFGTRIAGLEANALCLARIQSLAQCDGFSRADYARLLPDAAPEALDAAIAQLIDRDVLHRQGVTYTLSHRAVRDALRAGIPAADRAPYHRSLAELWEHSGRSAIAAAAHWFDAGVPARALDKLNEALTQSTDRTDLASRTRMQLVEIGMLLERALDAAEQLPRPKRELFELRRWVLGLAVACEDRMHHRVRAQLVARLERDSGLADYREQTEGDPLQRLTAALQRASERYAATPESERVYRVDEAIKHLVSYVVVSIAIGSRGLDVHLLASLPPLLEPFAPLSPLVHAMWQNALATLEIMQRRFESARTRWLDVFQRLEGITSAQLEHADAIRNAIAYALGTVEVLLGMHSAGRWAALLDKDPQQHVNAMYLRKSLCLQQGDFEAAERFRRKAEVLAVQATARQMFGNSSIPELLVHATARDLTGVKQIMDRLQPVAAQYTTWRPYYHLAEGHFHRLRGDFPEACAAFERGLAVFPEGQDETQRMLAWPSIIAGYIDTLLEQGEYARARAEGEKAVARCSEHQLVLGAADVERALALAEARTGDFERAAARLQTLIDAQVALGATGLNLGLNYEARARIAIWAEDPEAVERYGRLAANEYRHGRNSPLGARYERLMQEARRAGVDALPELASFESASVGTATLGGVRPTETVVTEALNGAGGREARTAMALGLLCDAHGASGGHLYLVGETGLNLAATLAADAPDALDDLVSSFWNQKLDEPEMPTAFVAAESPVPVTSNLWTDSRGTAYQPVPISCVVGGVPLYVGIAALIPGGLKPRHGNATDVTSTIGKYLIQCGDARGVPA